MTKRWLKLLRWLIRLPHKESDEVTDARERLKAVALDDLRVARLEARTQKILRENNLAPLIMRSFGIRK